MNPVPALPITTLTQTDTTTVGAPGGTGLTLTKTVDRANALPGMTLVYTINFQNNSSSPIASVVINDTTPAFTAFLTATCGANPPNFCACALSTAPVLGGTGAIVWTLTGPLQANAGSTVTFSVKVNP